MSSSTSLPFAPIVLSGLMLAGITTSCATSSSATTATTATTATSTAMTASMSDQHFPPSTVDGVTSPPGPATWNDATAMAQARVPHFLNRLAGETSARVVFGVLMDTVDDPGPRCPEPPEEAPLVDGAPLPPRLVWLDAVQHRDGVVSGIADTASRGAPQGHVLRGGIAAICDWVIVDGDLISGGFSLRLERSRLPPAQRERFDAVLGATFAPISPTSPTSPTSPAEPPSP